MFYHCAVIVVVLFTLANAQFILKSQKLLQMQMETVKVLLWMPQRTLIRRLLRLALVDLMLCSCLRQYLQLVATCSSPAQWHTSCP